MATINKHKQVIIKMPIFAFIYFLSTIIMLNALPLIGLMNKNVRFNFAHGPYFAHRLNYRNIYLIPRAISPQYYPKLSTAWMPIVSVKTFAITLNTSSIYSYTETNTAVRLMRRLYSHHTQSNFFRRKGLPRRCFRLFTLAPTPQRCNAIPLTAHNKWTHHWQRAVSRKHKLC